MPTRRRHPDFLDEIIGRGRAESAAFPRLVAAALERRRLLRALAREREALGLSQGQVAARMRTSQPAVARLESGEADVRVSTIERFAAALGRRVEYRVIESPPPRRSRSARG